MEYKALITVNWDTRYSTVAREPRKLVCGLRAGFQEEVTFKSRAVVQVGVRSMRAWEGLFCLFVLGGRRASSMSWGCEGS